MYVLKGIVFMQKLVIKANSTVKRFNFEKQELLKELQTQINEFK